MNIGLGVQEDPHSPTRGNPDGHITHSQSKGETCGAFSHAPASTEPAVSSRALALIIIITIIIIVVTIIIIIIYYAQ